MPKPIITLVTLILLTTCVASTAEPYFPRGTWDVDRMLFYEGWFGGHLRAMREKPLFAGSGANEEDGETVIRVLILPTFSTPHVIRLTVDTDGEMGFVKKTSSGQGGYDGGVLRTEASGPVAERTAMAILNEVGGAGIWAGRVPVEPAQVAAGGTVTVCSDGTQLVFEFARRDTYQIISRHECELEGDDALRNLVRLTLFAADVRLQRDDLSFDAD